MIISTPPPNLFQPPPPNLSIPIPQPTQTVPCGPQSTAVGCQRRMAPSNSKEIQ
jgi:hypothetical protein